MFVLAAALCLTFSFPGNHHAHYQAHPAISLPHPFICPPGKTRVEFCDADLPGLYVDVRTTNPGTGVYYLRYKDKNGKTCHQKLGRVCDLDLAEARKLAKTLKADIIVERC